ncbi:PTS transporter subunit EIIC [Anaerococcus provencensis]|uniref:PTS transporter subunit EIIC n=1 Tax=Anaerococcus provencensis TaxID=938293 RepID=UPI0002E80B53|nr:PTS transporter subunit EIIC [Anaerococcus provencensis]
MKREIISPKTEGKLLELAGKVEMNPYLQAIKGVAKNLLALTVVGSILALVAKNYLVDLTGISVGLIGIVFIINLNAEINKILGIEANKYLLINLLAIIALLFGKSEFDLSKLGTMGIILSLIFVPINIKFARKLENILDQILGEKIPFGAKEKLVEVLALIIIGLIHTMLAYLSVKIFAMSLASAIFFIVNPVLNIFDQPLVLGILVFIIQLYWYLGVHGDSIVDPFILPLAIRNINENIINWSRGLELDHIFTETFLSNFLLLSGSGLTIGLIIILLLKKGNPFYELGQMSIKPALLGINENIVFGIPLTKNKDFFLPFVIGPSLVAILVSLAFKYGYIGKAIIQPVGGLPFFVQGFLMNLSLKSILTQVIIIGLATLIYSPFALKLIKENNN